MSEAMRLVRSILLLLACWCGVAVAAPQKTFQIASEDLKQVPSEIVAKVRVESGFDQCDVVGKTAAIAPNGPAYWILTTKWPCNCGAHNCPIALLRPSVHDWVMVFFRTGSTLYRTRRVHHGLPDLMIDAGSAGEVWETHWRFDGSRYRKISTCGKFDCSEVRSRGA